MRPAPLPNLKVYLPEIRSGRGARSAARSGAGGERLPAALRAERGAAGRGRRRRRRQPRGNSGTRPRSRERSDAACRAARSGPSARPRDRCH